MTAWWVGPAAMTLLAALPHLGRWARPRLEVWRASRAERARFLHLARDKQARRRQRQRELAARPDWLLGLARWALWVIEPGPGSFSAVREWLAGRIADRVQAADWFADHDYQRYQGRQDVRDFRQVRADYRQRLNRGQIVLLTPQGDLLLYSLRGAHLAGVVSVPPATARSHRTRYRGDFPAPAHRTGSTSYYRPDDLQAFYQRHPELGHPAPLPGRLAVAPLTGDDDLDWFLRAQRHPRLRSGNLSNLMR